MTERTDRPFSYKEMAELLADGNTAMVRHWRGMVDAAVADGALVRHARTEVPEQAKPYYKKTGNPGFFRGSHEVYLVQPKNRPPYEVYSFSQENVAKWVDRENIPIGRALIARLGPWYKNGAAAPLALEGCVRDVVNQLKTADPNLITSQMPGRKVDLFALCRAMNHAMNRVELRRNQIDTFERFLTAGKVAFGKGARKTDYYEKFAVQKNIQITEDDYPLPKEE